MTTRRFAIVIPQQEKEILRELYREFRIPTDQYRRRDDELKRFVDSWNALTNRSDTVSEVLHYMITQRKSKQWVTFGGMHKRLAAMPEDFLSRREWIILRVIYEEMLIPLELGSDNLAFDETLARNLAREFYDRTRRSLAGRLLYAAIMQKRKRGEWPKLRPNEQKNTVDGRRRPFGDLDSIAS